MNLLPSILVATTLIGGGNFSGQCPVNVSQLQNQLNSNCVTKQQVIVGDSSNLESVLSGLGINADSVKSYIPSANCPTPNSGSDNQGANTPAPDTSTPATNTPAPDTSAPATNTPTPDTSAPATSTPTPDTSAPVTNTPTPNTNNQGKGTTTPSTSNQGSGSSGSETNAEKSYVEQVVDLVNAERAKEGLSALTMTDELNAAALVRAKETTKSFSHTRPNGSSFSTVLKENGISYRGAGENIAWGQSTPEEVVKAWMNSAGHRANIMNKNYTSIGVGYYLNGNTPYWSQLFTY
ncbi:MAG: transporter [Clostridiales bacterium]|nr:transporter [Clostridiales bacterium]